MGRSLALAALVLTGCYTPGLEEYDPSATTGTIELFGAQPAQGPIGGGTDVTITGTGLSGQIRVDFGGLPAQVWRVDNTTVVATTPKAVGAGVVDLYVESDEGSATLPRAFAYQDGTGTGTVDPGTGTGTVGGGTPGPGTTPPAGGVIGVLEFTLMQYACPDCLEGRPNDVIVQAAALLHDPMNASWNDYLPAQGTCAFNVEAPAMPVAAIDHGPQLLLSSGGTTVSLNQQGDGVYQSATLDQATLVRNATWDLSATSPPHAARAQWPGALTTARGFTTIEPVGLLLTDDDLLFTTPFSASQGQSIQWGPSGTGDIVVHVHSFAGEQGVYEGSLTCVAADTGSLHLPGEALGQFTPGAALLVTIQRFQHTRWTDPDTGGVIEGLNSFGVEGTAWLGP